MQLTSRHRPRVCDPTVRLRKNVYRWSNSSPYSSGSALHLCARSASLGEGTYFYDGGNVTDFSRDNRSRLHRGSSSHMHRSRTTTNEPQMSSSLRRVRHVRVHHYEVPQLSSRKRQTKGSRPVNLSFRPAVPQLRNTAASNGGWDLPSFSARQNQSRRTVNVRVVIVIVVTLLAIVLVGIAIHSIVRR